MHAKIMKFLLWAASRTLVFGDEISCSWVRGFPLKEGVKKGYPLKNSYFTTIGSTSVKTVADTYRLALAVTRICDKIFKRINIDDLDHFEPPQHKSFLVTFLQFRAATHILRMNCAKWLEID